MIKFFRRIRQRLVSENRFGKYLLYALGEIVLVVIGILIALQLNDWNDHRKQLELENEYYCRLLEDAALDEEQIQNLLNLAEDRLTSSNRAVRMLIDDEVGIRMIATEVYLSTKAIYSDFAPNNSAYEDLKSGANLNIISDKEIIKALNQYFNKVEELKSIIMINGRHAVEILFAHDDYFADGSALASIEGGRFKQGLDEDLRTRIKTMAPAKLSSQMKWRLLNESLEYVSVNTRQVELYNLMLQEIHSLKGLLSAKCR